MCHAHGLWLVAVLISLAPGCRYHTAIRGGRSISKRARHRSETSSHKYETHRTGHRRHVGSARMSARPSPPASHNTCTVRRPRQIQYMIVSPHHPPPAQEARATPPAAALCDGGVGGPVSLQPAVDCTSAAADGHRRLPLFQLTEANFSAGREGRRLVWRLEVCCV